MPEKAFYLVWREGGGTPTYKHPDVGSANGEAARLARQSPGARFYVLTATSAVQTTQPVEWTTLEEEPPF